MKPYIVALLVIAGLMGFATLMTFNVKQSYSISVSLESYAQKQLLTAGHEPEITFVSLQDTPYRDNLKILRVATHHVWGGESDLDDQVSNWLNSIGITNYPNYPISCKEWEAK